MRVIHSCHRLAIQIYEHAHHHLHRKKSETVSNHAPKRSLNMLHFNQHDSLPVTAVLGIGG